MTNCEHMKRVLIINAHAKDLQNYEVPHLGIEHEGYAPDIENLCGGDDVDLTICLDCGIVVGFAPMTDEQIEGAFNEDFEDDEDY